MANLEEVLKKLNKDKAEEDKIKYASEYESLTMNFSSSGSKYLDYYMDDKVIPEGAMTLLTGWEGSAKSSMALIIARELQKKYPNKSVVFLDGEQTVTDSHIQRFGIDKNKLVLMKDSVLEDMLDTAEAFSTADDVSAIVIDSVKSFFSKVIEEKSAEDYSIGVEAKKLGTRMPIIYSNCARRGIALIVINQWRENPGKMMGDPRVLPGGNWVKYMPLTHLDFTKKEFIKDSKNKIIGHDMEVKIRKSKTGAYDKKDGILLKFYYTGGFKETNEYANIFCEAEVAKKGGAWISFPNKDGEEVKANGLVKFATYLEENPEELEYLKTLL